MGSKGNFRAGQVVAYRDVDGGWEYDVVRQVNQDLRRTQDGKLTEEPTAWLRRSEQRRKQSDLRPLTAREAGPKHVKPFARGKRKP